MNSQDVSNILWAIAPETANLKCELVWRPFTAAMAKKSQGQAAELPVQELVSVAWAFADVVASTVETPRPLVRAAATASGGSREQVCETCARFVSVLVRETYEQCTHNVEGAS